MRGQGYDNGANMKGELAGVQAKIRNINSCAFLIQCGSHSLNLVVNDMAKSSLEGANFFNCKDFETILTDGESSVINSLKLSDEISVVCSLLEKDLPPLEVLKLITEMNFAPNFSIALRILLTLPISVAFGGM
ncbi:hypothetical protein AVEN_192415-1 [Araneus ventricosus]|uniref:DUF4371 domain-containing protein n=1 Tax=Araneus ventricosus TaxID=182803 RepID=A0A4Y1ZJP4_ARAVE|nr:hypothetical protein AVEN_192415-1 [Araneus ventricosus]